MRTHSGQVSFPGGGEDPEDGGDLVETALRETHEEIGIHRSDIRVLGLFDECLSIHGIVGSAYLSLKREI
jgi:8-oxo-dGTP pyrophosphatase MutT (NUDIX family)